MTTRYLTTGEAARRIGVKPDTVRRACSRGRVPGATWQGTPQGGRWLVPERLATPEAWRKAIGPARFQAGQDPREKRS